MNDEQVIVNCCKGCGYKVEKCLNLPEGKKCCPDCAIKIKIQEKILLIIFIILDDD